MVFSLSPTNKSVLLAITSSLLLSISMSLAKTVNSEVPTTLLVFIRSCFGILFLLPILVYNTRSITRTQNLLLHILRTIIVFSAMLCTYYAYRNLPLAFAASISMSSPLFTTILSFIILKEKINSLKLLVILIGYLGVIIVIRPSTFLLDLGTISSILANILAACALIIVKILSRHDSTMTIMFYTNIGLVLVACVFSLDEWKLLNFIDYKIISIMGLLGVTMQFCSIIAVTHSSPSFVAPFEFTRIFFSHLIGIIIFKEIVDIYIVIGSLVILFSVYILARLEIKDKVK